LDKDAATGETYFHKFPFFTTRDMIRAYQPLKEFLGITKIHMGVGGSMGGQQLLEWAIEEPNAFEIILPIATNAQHSPWGIGFNASQRMAIEADVTWKEKREDAGIEGMKVARSIALLSYRHYETYGVSQLETDADKIEKFKSESYQRYQGEKLAKRFNAFSYHALSLGMDAHNVSRGRKSVEAALKKIKAKTLVIGISSDLLFPVEEQQFLAANIPNAEYEEINSFYGHDGFLLEYEAMELVIKKFLDEHKEKVTTNYAQPPADKKQIHLPKL
jgi:homoserine O-acetyltransferase/O-succinyltransferase